MKMYMYTYLIDISDIFFSLSGYTALKGGRFGGSPMRKILRIVRHQLSEVRGRASIL